MNSNQLLKVAGFMKALHSAMAPDHPNETRAGRAAGLGLLGAGAGAAGGYLHAANEFAGDPFGNPAIMEQLAKNPIKLKQMFDESKAVAAGAPNTLKSLARLNGELLPAIAKVAPRRLALPALAIGGLGALAGAGLPTHHTTPGERLRKLWDHRPHLLK